MRKFLSAAALGLALAGLVGDALLAQPVGPPNVIGCNKTALASGAVASIQLVASATGRTINICGFIGSATGAMTLSLVYGTGATCGTGTIPITIAHNIPAGAFIAYGTDSAWFSVPSGQNLCTIWAGTGPGQLTVMYSQ